MHLNYTGRISATCLFSRKQRHSVCGERGGSGEKQSSFVHATGLSRTWGGPLLARALGCEGPAAPVHLFVREGTSLPSPGQRFKLSSVSLRGLTAEGERRQQSWRRRFPVDAHSVVRFSSSKRRLFFSSPCGACNAQLLS